MQNTFLYLILLFSCFTANCETQEVWINIKNNYSTRFPVERNSDGAFIEFLLDWINGPTGFWSQELIDRGFDDATCEGKLCHWNYMNYIEALKNIKLETENIYNENGVFAVELSPIGEMVGIEQEFYYDDTTKLNIYVYAKSKVSGSFLDIDILDINDKILETYSVILSDSYLKYTFISSEFQGKNKLKIRFSANGNNSVFIDEASVMPNNNVNGIRKEIFDIFKMWSPGILRYPGGWHADLKINKLEYAIGDIDKRESPLKDGRYYQRMDFGYNEYFKFINALNISPHIVVNFGNGTPEEAANLVEYLNGDTTTFYGSLRAKHGYQKPYNVEWWEVGNEQWSDVYDYSNRMIEFSKSMKNKDNDIKIIVDGDIWQGEKHYLTMDSIAGEHFDLYGYHPIMGLDTNVINSGNDTTKMGYLGLPYIFEQYSKNLNNIIKEKGNKHNIGVTEWSHFLLNLSPQYNDLTRFTSQFQYGLYNALMINFHLRNSHYLKMNEKTAHIGSVQREFLENNKRLIYIKPPVIVSKMIKDHIGKEVVDFDLFSLTYNAFGYEKMIWTYDVPFVDVSVTANDDTTFVYVINRNIHDSVKVNFNSNLNFSDNKGIVYTYYQSSLQAELTYDNLNALDPVESEITISDNFTFPPHSFCILALPTKNALAVRSKENIISEVIENNVFKTGILENIEKINIYNLSGDLIKNYITLSVSPHSFDISYLENGVYFYMIETKNKKYVGKFLKTN